MTSGNPRAAALCLSHAVINTLLAGYQGLCSHENALRQLRHPAYRSVRHADLQWQLQRVESWAARVWQGEVLVERADRAPGDLSATAEGSEGSAIWRLFNDLGRELDLAIGESEELLDGVDLEDDLDAAQRLVARLAGFARGRDRYLHGLIRYCERFQVEEPLVAWRLQSALAEQGLHGAQRLTELFGARRGDDAADRGECGGDYGARALDLWHETRTLLGALRAQRVDLLAVHAMYLGEVSYETLGVPATDAADWRQLDIAVDEAAYWYAYGFDAGDADRWRRLGFESAALAADWRNRDFGEEEACEWEERRFEPRVAYELRALGIDHDEALEFCAVEE